MIEKVRHCDCLQYNNIIVIIKVNEVDRHHDKLKVVSCTLCGP